MFGLNKRALPQWANISRLNDRTMFASTSDYLASRSQRIPSITIILFFLRQVTFWSQHGPKPNHEGCFITSRAILDPLVSARYKVKLTPLQILTIKGIGRNEGTGRDNELKTYFFSITAPKTRRDPSKPM